jgi:hypothetical protein
MPIMAILTVGKCSANFGDVLGLILQTDSTSNDGMSLYEDKYLNLALGVVSGISRQVFWSFLDIPFQCFAVAMAL